jgi:hypothetical protein
MFRAIRFLVLSHFLSLMMAMPAYSKSGGTHELGLLYRYDSAKSPTTTYTIHEIDTFLLVPVKVFWLGGEFGYANVRNRSNASSNLEIGVLAKYWLVEPGGSVGLNFSTGIATGKENDGHDPVSTFTLKAGPELAWFIWEGAAVSTKIQYASRRAGPTYTVVGIRSGISLFF